MRAAQRFLRSAVLATGAILGTVCLLWTLGVLVAGVTPLVVLSGSMSPALEAGDVAFARATPATDIDVGDIVSVTDADGVRVTHRVDRARAAGDGLMALTLRGDANESADAETAAVASVDRVIGHVRGVGVILSAAGTPWGIATGLALLVACLGIGLRPPRGESGGRYPSGGNDPLGEAAPRRSVARAATGGVLLLVSLIGVGSASAPQQSLAYFTDTPTVSSPVNAIDSAPWFTCHQAMTSTELNALAYYRLNEAVGATAAADSSGHNRAGTFSGTAGVGYSLGQAQPCARDNDTAMSFTGSGGSVLTPNVASLTGTPGARWNTFTLSLWFRGVGSSSQGILIGMQDSRNATGTAYDRRIYVDPQGRLRFGVFAPSVGAVRTLVTPPPAASGYVDFRTSRWHMVTAELSSAGLKLFIDGEPFAAQTTEQGGTAASITSAYQYPGEAYWRIGDTYGADAWPGGLTSGHWKGSISKVGIWDRALTDQQIRDLYRSGIPLN